MAISVYKRAMSVLLACSMVFFVHAQDKLVIKGKPNDLYVVYKTNGKESLQSISNGFGIAVPKLSSYNKINISAAKPFPRGTAVKIPVTKNNLLQRAADNSDAVVHVIGKGDNLFRLSQAYYKVPIASLRSWNNLKKDAVKPGQQIIVGYMVNAKPSIGVADKKADTKKEEPAANAAAEVKADAVKDVATVNNPQVIQPSLEKVSGDKKNLPAPAPVRNDVIVNAPATETPAAKASGKKVNADADYVPREGDEGFFAASYAEHTKDQTQQFRSGDAAVFKTISGWTDRKFYVLMNDIAPKTIVRITGTGNKSICAMVLGPLQETKGGNGLLLRMSNSAASALGVSADKFTVTVTYFE